MASAWLYRVRGTSWLKLNDMSTLDSAHELPFSVLCHMLSRGHEEASNALMELYTRTAASVFALAKTMAASPVHQEQAERPTPEEALRKVYLDLWVNARQLSDWPVETEPEWEGAFYVFAHKTLVTAFNAEDQTEPRIPQVASAYMTERAPTPHVAVPHGLTAVVEALPAAAREMFNLAYLQGLNYYQIAEKTGASVATVKSRLRIMVIRLIDEQPEAPHDPLQVQQHYFARDDSKPQQSGQFGANLEADLQHGLLLPWAELVATGALNASERSAMEGALTRVDEDTKRAFVSRYRQSIVALATAVKNLYADVPVELREQIATDIAELDPAPQPQPREESAPAIQVAEEQTRSETGKSSNKAPLVIGAGLLLVVLVVLFLIFAN